MKTIPRDTFTLTLSPAHPAAAEVELGEEFNVECPCARGGIFQEDGTASAPLEKANPMAGPVAVKGVEAGESIAVSIKSLEPVGYGLSCNLVFTPVDGEVEFLDGLRAPVDGNIGCLGLAPKLEEDETDNMTCGPHGGNFDCGDMGPGATVFMRARVDGANLGFGDVHWAMGDGEINGTGVEGAADIVVQVDKAVSAGVEWQWIVRNGLVMTLGGGPNLRVAQRVAYEEMMTLCRNLFDLERKEVQGRITVAGDVKICQSVCDAITVRQCMPLDLLGSDEDAFLKRMLQGE